MPAKHKLVMVRHGETELTRRQILLGWYDVDLSEKGRQQAMTAGKMLKKDGYQFDIVYTSWLKRAKNTAKIILHELELPDVPIEKTWRLNDRHYGVITCLNKDETTARYGDPQVQFWRRGYDIAPPVIVKDHPYYDSIHEDPRYAQLKKTGEMPFTESLKTTVERTLPYWHDVIVPQIKANKNVLIVAHSHSLRAIVKELDKLSDFDIMEVILPPGIPFVYELDEVDEDLIVDSLGYLGDDVLMKQAEEMTNALNPQAKKA